MNENVKDNPRDEASGIDQEDAQKKRVTPARKPEYTNRIPGRQEHGASDEGDDGDDK